MAYCGLRMIITRVTLGAHTGFGKQANKRKNIHVVIVGRIDMGIDTTQKNMHRFYTIITVKRVKSESKAPQPWIHSLLSLLYSLSLSLSLSSRGHTRERKQEKTKKQTREKTREKEKEENNFFMAFFQRRQPPLLVEFILAPFLVIFLLLSSFYNRLLLELMKIFDPLESTI